MITPLKDAVYGGGEPTGEAHARMKAAMVAAGIFKNGTMRPPTVAPDREGTGANRRGRCLRRSEDRCRRRVTTTTIKEAKGERDEETRSYQGGSRRRGS